MAVRVEMEMNGNPNSMVRPRTRGELKQRLSRGESCEVASHAVEITEIMLRGWQCYGDFAVRKSENEGWSIFEPIKQETAKGIHENHNNNCAVDCPYSAAN
jgi:hypothetical protein